MTTSAAKREKWQPKHLAAALDDLRKHVGSCPVCRTWGPLKQRNPHCQNLRLTVNRVVYLWNQVPAGQRVRQLAMFDNYQEEVPEDTPPF